MFFRLAKIRKSNSTKFWWRRRAVRTLIHCYGEYEPKQVLWKTVWNYSKVKNTKSLQLNNPPPTIHTPKKNFCTNVPEYIHMSVLDSHFHKSQKLETVQMSINRTTDKSMIVGHRNPEQWPCTNHRYRHELGKVSQLHCWWKQMSKK